MNDKPLPQPNCPTELPIDVSVRLAHVADIDRANFIRCKVLPIPAAFPGTMAKPILFRFRRIEPRSCWSGLGWAATTSGDPFALGDKFNLTFTNNKSGPLQTFLARAHGFQLPSA